MGSLVTSCFAAVAFHGWRLINAQVDRHGPSEVYEIVDLFGVEQIYMVPGAQSQTLIRVLDILLHSMKEVV